MPGGLVDTVHATDADELAEIQYSIQGSAAPFQINNTTGELRYEPPPEIDFENSAL